MKDEERDYEACRHCGGLPDSTKTVARAEVARLDQAAGLIQAIGIHQPSQESASHRHLRYVYIWETSDVGNNKPRNDILNAHAVLK